MERTVNMTGFLSSTIPVGMGVLGILIANFPVSLLAGAVPPPLFVLMPIYFWTLVRPDLMRPSSVFFLGVLQDFLSGGGATMGVWTIAFVATYAAVDRGRDAFAGLGGLLAILGFATAAFVACGTAYLVVTFLAWRIVSVVPLATELAMTILFYMPIVLLLGAIHRRFVGPLRREF
ncbi:MAG TPA: hypothetical protein VGG10_13945 [Rhizomicrobium sp.]|jgi:rod shape-determining protein MreD